MTDLDKFINVLKLVIIIFKYMGYKRRELFDVIRGLSRGVNKLVTNSAIVVRNIIIVTKIYLIPIIVVVLVWLRTTTVYIDEHYWSPQRKRLILKFKPLQRWDAWAYRPQARKSMELMLAVLFISSIFQAALQAAPDLNDDWDLANAVDYTYDSGIEMVSGVARLKTQNYENDADTRALYHFDESGGINASDSSSNSNNATISGGSFVAGSLNNAVSLDGIDDTVTAPNSASLQLGQQHTIEAWTKFNNNFDSTSHDRRNAVVDKGDYQLYYDNETGKLTYEIANSTSSNWTQTAGSNIGGSWGTNGKRSVTSSIVMGSDVYAGLGNQLADAEVWMWNGSDWELVGGDGVNGSWDDQTFEDVYSMTTDGTNLYAGLGTTAGDAEVWRWDGATWTKIGGDAVSSSWQVSTFETVGSLNYFGSNLYAGLGSSASDAEVWRWNGTTWTKIGGDSLNSGWVAGYEIVSALADDGTNLYAGLGTTANDAEVWMWNGTAWSQIGGDSLNSGWAAGFEAVRAMRYIAGILYAGLGDTAGDADLWSWNGATWSQIGGDGLNGSWNTNYEGIYAIGTDGTDIYAGLGTGNGDGEVWRRSGGSWSQIGGDGLNGSWTTNFGDTVYTLPNNGTTVYAGIYDTAGGGYLYSWNGTTWTTLGGQYINNSWGYYGQGSVEVLQVSGEYLYAGLGSASGSAQIWRLSGSTWSLVGGQGINNSWPANTYEQVSSMSSHEGNLYVGLGTTANDSEVWMWNGTTWSQIGGDSLNSGWTTNFEEVNSLASFNGDLYAGLGNSNNDAEVWRWNGATWTKIGGDSLNSGWTTNYDRVSSLAVYKGNLIAGLGAGAGEAELWQWNGAAWSKIGGDSLNSSWDSTFEQIEALIQFNNKLYIGLGNTAGDGEVWELDDTTWTKIGGDDLNNSWADGTYERVRTLATYNGDLFAGLGSGTGEGEVWRYSAGSWTKVGGNSVNTSWGNTMEEVESFSTYQGKLYAGTGNTANADATVWSLGDNGYLQSTTSSFNTDWRHVAASYNGSTMRIYINGTLENSLSKTFSVATSNRDLLISTGYGGREYGKPQARFQGLIDEVRLSSVSRSSFTTSPYASSPQSLRPQDSVRKNGVWHWDTFSHNETPNGGSVNYRLSSDEGTTWLFWDGLAWSQSNSLTEANTVAVITANFDEFPVTFDGMLWQAVLSGNGSQQVILDGVNADATSDTIDPTSNPSNIVAYKANGGTVLAQDDWTNGGSPYFTWDVGDDAESEVKGYCAYLGTDELADPVTTKGLLGNSPAPTGDNCQFMVTGTSLDLATPGLLSTPLSTTNDTYYLNLRTIDNAGNVTNTSSQFSFRFDNTMPTNPGYITAPSGFINTKDVSMSWPTIGGSAPSDSNSGLVGLQYRIGAGGTWYGDGHTGLGDMADLLNNDGEYNTLETPDYASLIEGINTVYFRTWDLAGNVSTTYVTATLKINTSGAPSVPNNLVATPTTNTANSFGFNWDAPTTFIGDENNITYCYTINTLPSPSSCAYTGPGSTELTVGAYATQPGLNTMYIAARDESSNINYDNYASTGFTADTPSPGVPLNTDLVDVSIKNTSNWRLALTWDVPTYTGGGINNYRIFRSTDNITFNQVGTSSSTTYIDAGLSQQTYYYNISACDNTNNCGASGTTVSGFPTGKFTSPATLIDGPATSDITTKRAKVSWTTDRASDSKVQIGTQSGEYSPSEVGNSDQTSVHEISLDNLSPGTTYYLKVKWTDEDGNTGTSSEQTFTTAPAPSIIELEVTGVGLGSAGLAFTTRGATKATVYYGTSESFGGLKTVNTATVESRYQVELDDLTDGTKYYYMVSTYDQEGAEYRGNVGSFSTPPRPRITNLRFQPVAGEPTSTQQVTWDTNVPSSSQVTYNIVNGTPIEVQDSSLVTSHEIVIRNLSDDSEYVLTALSRDASGNSTTSDRQVFRTALDTRPPKATDVVVESSIRGSGSEARGQIVVSWRTDEPSTSQVAYAEGSDAVTFNSKTVEDTILTTEHLVIISDLPTSRVFSVQPLSKDSAGNEGQGETQTAIIGRASDSAITVVFNTLKAIFGL